MLCLFVKVEIIVKRRIKTFSDFILFLFFWCRVHQNKLKKSPKLVQSVHSEVKKRKKKRSKKDMREGNNTIKPLVNKVKIIKPQN